MHQPRNKRVLYQYFTVEFCPLIQPLREHMQKIDLFSLYILFSHFRPRDAHMGIFLLFIHYLCVNLHVHKTTFERNYFLE